MVKLLGGQPFESEALDRLAETMKATPVLNKGALSRYYKVRSFYGGCVSYQDALVFDAKYYDSLTPDELLAVGAHEYNHIIKTHVIKRTARLLLPTLVIAALIGYLVANNYALISSIPILSNLNRGLFSALATGLSLLLVLDACFYLNASWLRQQETECDLSAVEFANGEAMISALVKFRKLHPRKNWDVKLSKLMPQTYPTLEQRIKNIQMAMDNKKSN
jgi:Zn-dependent protease with chaperone function